MRKKLSDMAVLIKNISTYQKTKDIYRGYIKAKDKEVYKMLRYSMLGFSVNLPGKSGRWISKTGYKVMNKWIGFN